MNTNVKKTSALVAALVASAALATAQEPAAAPAARERTPVPLKLQVVFGKLLGERRLASHPYAVSMTTGEGPTRLRMGIQVPLKYESKETPGNVVYKNVGSSIDCRAEAMEGRRFRILCTFEQSSLHDVDNAARSSLAPPMLRTFSSDAHMVLRDGETAHATLGTDPITGETLKIDVTLDVLE